MKCNQLDDQGDLEENSDVENDHENEECMEEWDPSKEDHDDHENVEGLHDANLRIENVHDISKIPIEVNEDEHDEVGTFIQERGFEDMNITVPCEDDISNFLCINEGRWDMGNHHFDSDPIYDTDMENEVEIDSPFLQDITHSDMTTHTNEMEDHCFPMHEGGLLEIVGHIYDIDVDTDKGLVFPCLPKISIA